MIFIWQSEFYPYPGSILGVPVRYFAGSAGMGFYARTKTAAYYHTGDFAYQFLGLAVRTNIQVNFHFHILTALKP